jgi:hypothetical protein
MSNETTGVMQFNRWVGEAKKLSRLTWRQTSAKLAYDEWESLGSPVLIYEDILTATKYINQKERWRLGEIISPSYTAKMLEGQKFPHLSAILSHPIHEKDDWAGMLARREFELIEPENTGWSVPEHLIPDYDWYWENAELTRDEVDKLWQYQSIQMGMSVANSIIGGTAKGMFVLMSDGGEGKSTFIEAIAQTVQDFVFNAMAKHGFIVPRGVSIISTDNGSGSMPSEFEREKAILGSVCTYYTEKSSYLTSSETLDWFKGITAGASSSFRKIMTQDIRQGTQRATLFLDFNPSMASTMLSGKLNEDVNTARRFNCFYIKAKNPNAWQVDYSHPDGGYLKTFGTAAGRERFWKWVKWCYVQREVLLGVIPEDIKPLFNKQIKALSASSATSTANQLTALLQDETKLFVNRQYLEGVGIQKRDLAQVGKAVEGYLLTPRGQHQFTLYLGGKQHKAGRSEWVITKDGKSWGDVKALIADLFEQTGIDTNNQPEVKLWLQQLMWQEDDKGGWRLVNSTYRRPHHLSVVGQPTNQSITM